MKNLLTLMIIISVPCFAYGDLFKTPSPPIFHKFTQRKSSGIKCEVFENRVEVRSWVGKAEFLTAVEVGYVSPEVRSLIRTVDRSELPGAPSGEDSYTTWTAYDNGSVYWLKSQDSKTKWSNKSTETGDLVALIDLLCK